MADRPEIIDNREVKLIVSDAKTGEVVAELKDGDKIYTRDIYENIIAKNGSKDPNDLKYYYVSYASFIKINSACMKELSNLKLTSIEWKIFFYLCEKIDFNSNYISHSNGKPIRKNNVQEDLGISKDSVNKTFSKFVKLGIINYSITQNSCKYFFNPYILLKGRYANKTLVKLFNHTKWKEISGLNF